MLMLMLMMSTTMLGCEGRRAQSRVDSWEVRDITLAITVTVLLE